MLGCPTNIDRHRVNTYLFKMENQPNAERENQLTFRFLAEPTDVNFGGKVHGGAVMKWIDQAGYSLAVNWSRAYAVTVYVGGIRFYKPIRIGDIVEVKTKVIYTGRTSMHIAVDIAAENPKTGRKAKTTHCVIVFVAVDDDNEPATVPKWIPETEEEKQLEHYAIKLMELRKDIDREMEPFMN